MNVKKKIPSANDYIFLEGIQLPCFIGTTKEERSAPQDLHLSIKLFLDLRNAGRSDVLKNTIDYSEVLQNISSFLTAKSYTLVESVAESIASFLLKKYSLSRVEIKIGKKVFPHVHLVGVHLIRSKK